MIRKISAIAAFCILVCGTLSAQYRQDIPYSSLNDTETVAAMKSHVNFLTSAMLEGRRAGSQGEKEAAEYLHSQLEQAGVDMLCPGEGDVFGITLPSGDTLVSRNVFGYIQGYDKALNDRYIVVGARMDNLGTHTMTVDGEKVEQVYSGANGNASGMAMLIELARKVSLNSILFRRSIIFVGFGASCNSMSGSWYFLNRTFKEKDKIDAMINLDMLGTPSDAGMYVYTSSNSDLNSLVSTVSSSLQPTTPVLTAGEPYPSDHRSFYAEEIPSAFFTTGRYPEHDSFRDTPSILDYGFMEKELEYIFNFTQSLACTNRTLQFRPADSDSGRGISGDKVYSYYDCDVRPMFLNNPDPSIFMSKWVYQYLKYPEAAVRSGIQGTVQVSFVIEKNGNVSNVRIFKGVDPLLDDEAVRVIAASPKWRPARVRGEKVRSIMTVSVEFRLTKKENRHRFGINGINVK